MEPPKPLAPIKKVVYEVVFRLIKNVQMQGG
jgi:hypothetical protein